MTKLNNAFVNSLNGKHVKIPEFGVDDTSQLGKDDPVSLGVSNHVSAISTKEFAEELMRHPEVIKKAKDMGLI